MGIIDGKTKQYVKRPEVFADLFNYLLYRGGKVVHPEHLSEMDTADVVFPKGKGGKSFTVQKYRDVLKNAIIMEDSRAAYMLILGVENQDRIHYAMPVRNMLYDAISYSSQVAALAREHRRARDSQDSAEFLSGMSKDDRLTPVVTLAVYFGQDIWDGPLSLHQMLTTQKTEILEHVPDYRINLLAPVSMSEEEIRLFRSDFRELAEFIRCGRDREAMKRLAASGERFRHMDPLTAEVANLVTGSGLELKVNEKGEVDMCAAIMGIRDEGRREGRIEGKLEGLVEGARRMAFGLVRKGRMTMTEGAQETGMELALFEKEYQKYIRSVENDSEIVVKFSLSPFRSSPR